MTPVAELVALDTRVFLHLCRGDALGEAAKIQFDLLDRAIRPFLSIVSYADVLLVAHTLREGKWSRADIASVQSLARQLTIVPLDNAVISKYVELGSYMENAGRALGNNLWTAATSLVAADIRPTVLLTCIPDLRGILHPQLTVEVFDERVYFP